jgi:hypothetical protein
MEEEYVSVKEFARATERFPNQIYDLINKGNSFGKLKTVQQDGQIMIPVSEIKEFPFNASDNVRIEFAERLNAMEKQIAILVLIRKELKAVVARLDNHGV